MPVVHFVKQGISLECPVGSNLRELALRHEIDLYAFPSNWINCRGSGLCGTCRVKIDDPRAVSARTRADESKNGWEGSRYRLACQSEVLANVSVVTNPRRVLAWTNHPAYAWMQQESER